MSDLAKRVADAIRRENCYCNAQMGVTVPAKDEALAAFIERANACRDEVAALREPGCAAVDAYDAAIRDLAQAMEVSDD